MADEDRPKKPSKSSRADFAIEKRMEQDGDRDRSASMPEAVVRCSIIPLDDTVYRILTASGRQSPESQGCGYNEQCVGASMAGVRRVLKAKNLYLTMNRQPIGRYIDNKDQRVMPYDWGTLGPNDGDLFDEAPGRVYTRHTRKQA